MGQIKNGHGKHWSQDTERNQIKKRTLKRATWIPPKNWT